MSGSATENTPETYFWYQVTTKSHGVPKALVRALSTVLDRLLYRRERLAPDLRGAASTSLKEPTCVAFLSLSPPCH